MRHLFDILCLGLEKAAKIFCISLIFIIVIAMTAQILFRYVLDYPLSYTDEVCLVAMSWLTFVGAGWIYRTRAHITVDLLGETASDSLFVRLADVAAQLCVIAVILVLASQALELTPQAMRLEMGTLELSRFFMHYLPLLIGCGLIIIFAIDHALKALTTGVSKEMHVVTPISE